MKKQSIFSISYRYMLIALLGLGNLFVFYKLFSFPTIFVSSLILSFFRETIIIEKYIIFGDSLLEIANSCVAGSAYYFFFFLAMSIPLVFLKRVKLVLFCFFLFFIANILRIVAMAFLVDSFLFQGIHLFLWHFFSTIFVLLIWFSAIRIFKIKEIPVYTDFLSIKKMKQPKTRKKNN